MIWLDHSELKIISFVCIRSLDAMLRQGLPTLWENTEPQPQQQQQQQPQNSCFDTSNEDRAAKRRLRSHRPTEENEFIFDLGAVTSPSSRPDEGSTASNSSSIMDSNQITQHQPLRPNQLSSLALLRNLLPVNMAVTSKTRELLQSILAWQIVPQNAPAEPSMIYGSVHLSRLVVKLPDFLNAIPIPDEKLKLLLQYLDCFVE